MGEAGCTDLLSVPASYISFAKISLANNFPSCLQDMTFLVLKKKFESI